jgi:hypothetical protein
MKLFYYSPLFENLKIVFVVVVVVDITVVVVVTISCDNNYDITSQKYKRVPRVRIQ